MSSKEPTPGPYNNTRTVTLEFTPFKVTITTDEKASHVPAAPCGCGGGVDLMGILQAAKAAMQGGGVPPTSTDPVD